MFWPNGGHATSVCNCGVTLTSKHETMKLHLQRSAGEEYLIRGYSAGEIVINQQRYHQSLILAPDRLIPEWEPQQPQDLCAAHFEPLLALQPEVILLGTGTRLQFPAPQQLKPLIVAGIGYEVMDTAAACRTYNILMGEGRRVVAGLIMLAATD